tara:strand:+ start:3062 stop:4261 length:1200 start_codon:yes stop_codon:yes gene_type:complete
MDNFSKLSINLTKGLSKEDKKRHGIYFTSREIIRKNLRYIDFSKIDSILEPSCGSCEFINIINELYPKKKIVGIEYKKEIYEMIKELKNENIDIINEDYLKYEDDKKYDLIIGNPPYYVMKKEDVDKRYNKFYDGRPNIFILFIIKSIELLNSDGVLSFVLPKSFANCLYYNKSREYISKNLTILNILECNNDFIETEQSTIILIVKNKRPIKDENDRFMISVNNYLILESEENIKRLKELYEGSSCLNSLKLKASVGTVIWNECKNILTNDNSKTRLIYSSDIKNNKLELMKYKNVLKKNYIDKEGLNNPLLVINRGYGVGNYNLNYCLIDVDYKYLIENHLISINSMDVIDKEELRILYKKVMNSLEDKRTKEFINLYFGNSAINTTELNNILPIYL